MVRGGVSTKHWRPGLTNDFAVVRRAPTRSEYLALREAVRWAVPTEEEVATVLDGSLCVVAEVQGETVGMGRLVSGPRSVFVMFDVVVRPDRHGVGLGSAIVGDLEKMVIDVVGEGVILVQSSANALSFYRRFGYSVVEGCLMVKELRGYDG